jgi:uncharacterized FlaG/YvyC family protein
MNVPPIGATHANTSATTGHLDAAQTENRSSAVTAARILNSLNIVGREYSVVRDPASHRFILVVRDQETGTVLDQFPPEEILKMLAQLSSVAAGKTSGEWSE